MAETFSHSVKRPKAYLLKSGKCPSSCHLVALLSLPKCYFEVNRTTCVCDVGFGLETKILEI